MKELTDGHKKSLDRLVKKNEYIFSEKNKDIFSRKIYKIKSGLILNGLKEEGYNIHDYMSKLANIYVIDQYKNKK